MSEVLPRQNRGSLNTLDLTAQANIYREQSKIELVLRPVQISDVNYLIHERRELFDCLYSILQ
ncbi:hypothetical protein Srut_10760 [Streptomyces rutgersensis]|nr:hypothetical protein Srut_10760 [Streptomyces rutgersensis]